MWTQTAPNNKSYWQDFSHLASSELTDATDCSQVMTITHSTRMILCEHSSNKTSQAQCSIVRYNDLELSFKCWSSVLLKLSHKSSFKPWLIKYKLMATYSSYHSSVEAALTPWTVSLECIAQARWKQVRDSILITGQKMSFTPRSPIKMILS